MAISLNFGRSREISLNRAPLPQIRPGADPRTAGDFQDSVDIFLHNRPQNHGVRNSTTPSQISGDFAEFRQTARNSPRIAPLYRRSGRRAGSRTAENSQDSVEIFLRNRPQNRGVRNSAISAQVRGGFAEFRHIARNSPESRPCTADPAGRRIREPPEIFRIPLRYFYTIDHRITGCEIRPFQPK